MRLENPKDRASIEETLRQGESTEFWGIIKQALEDNIDQVQAQLDGDEIAELPASEYKIKAEILKWRKNHIKSMLDLPQSVIAHLKSPDQTEPDLDPY